MTSLSDEIYALIEHAEKDKVEVRHDHMAYLHKTALALETSNKRLNDELRRSGESVKAVISTLRKMVDDGQPDLFRRAIIALWAHDFLDSDSQRQL